MNDTANSASKLQAVLFAILMVTSVFVGFLGVAGTAAAANFDSGGVDPATVDESTTTTHTVNLTLDGVDASGNGAQDVVVTLPSALNTSSTQVTNSNVASGGVTVGSTNVDSAANQINVTLEDSGGSSSETVEVSFDLTNVAAPSVTSDTQADATVSYDADQDGDFSGSAEFDGVTLETLTIQNVSAVDQTVGDADPGTIFKRLNPTSDSAGQKIGLLKRGESGELLYNPNEQNLNLEPGDVLVARNDERFRVTVEQRLRGSEGFVGPGATVFQGEQDTRFVGFEQDSLIGIEDQGADGITLSLNTTISGNQDEGVYDDSEGNRVTIEEPEIRRFEIINQEGDRIEAGEGVQEDEIVILQMDINFLAAENAEFGPIQRVDRGTLPTEVLTSREEVLTSDRFSAQQKRIVEDFIPAGKAREGDSGLLNRDISNPNTAPRGTVFAVLELSEVDKPGNYSALGLSENDEPAGDMFSAKDLLVSQPFTLTAQDDATLNLNIPENASVVQGEFLDFRVNSGTKGQNHVVSIDEDELRDERDRAQIDPDGDGEVNVEDFADVFRENSDAGFVSGVLLNNGEVVVDNGARFALNESGQVEAIAPPNSSNTVSREDISQVFTFLTIDVGDFGIGTVDTDELDDTNVDVNLFEGGSGFFTPDGPLQPYLDDNGQREIDEKSFNIEDGDDTLSITTPGQTYVVGEDIDIEGSASTAFDEVAIYARDEGDYQLLGDPGNPNSLDSIAVQGDGNWDESDVDLSRLSNVMNIPGTVRLGVITTRSADLDGDGEVEQELTTSEFNSGSADQKSVRILDQTLTADIRTFGGQVAEEDGTVNISGEARGAEEVAIVFVDEDGNVVTTSESVDDKNIFDNDDVALSDVDGELAEGEINAFVISAARDDIFGEPGSATATSASELASRFEEIEDEEAGITGEQGAELIRELTVEEDGSDDLLVNKTFELTDASTTIEAVYPEGNPGLTGVPVQAGETLVVEGLTNLQSDDNTITLEAVNGPDADLLDVADVDEWGQDGRYSLSIGTPENLTAGNYTLEIDDGETITQETIQVVSGSDASISISDKETRGETVRVDSVTLSRGGYVQLRVGGLEGQSLGISSYLSPGTHENVPVVLDQTLEEDTDVVAVAHLGSPSSVGTPYEVSGSTVSDSATVSLPAAEQPATPTTDTPEPTTDTPEPTTDTPEPTTDTPEPEPTETDGAGSPGFGLIAALLALVALVGGALYYYGERNDDL